jgi:hypothetical protein
LFAARHLCGMGQEGLVRLVHGDELEALGRRLPGELSA